MNSEKIKVVIVQEKIPKYRIPLYQSLANLENIDLLVLHSQDNNINVEFDNAFVKKISLSKIYIQLGLWKYCRKSDVVVVDFDIRWLMNIAIALAFRQKVLLWGHGFGRSRVGNKFRLVVSKLVKGILLYETKELEQFVRSGISRYKLFYAGNTVYVKDPIRSNLNKTQFVYMGRLQHRKRVDLLIKAFAKISNVVSPAIGITILGDGEIKNDLIRLASDLGINDKVKFLPGTHDESRLRAVYADAIAYVSPGHVGLGVLHSFAYGVPVITTESKNHAPEVGNIKNNVNGLVYNEKEIDLSQILHKLCVDSGYQKILSKNAYEYYSNHRRMEHMVDRFLDAIEYAQTH